MEPRCSPESPVASDVTTNRRSSSPTPRTVVGIDNEAFDGEASLGCSSSIGGGVVPPIGVCRVSCFLGRPGELCAVTADLSSRRRTPPVVFSRGRPVRLKRAEKSTSDAAVESGVRMTATSGEHPRGERRRGRHPPPPPPPLQTEFTHLHEPGPEMLPDILNSHLPPPYTTLPDRGVRRLPPPVHPPPPPPSGPQPPLCPASPTRPGRTRGVRSASSSCHPFPGRGRLRSSGRAGSVETDEPKHCCGVMVTQTVSIRWFIVMIAFVGLCCAIVGTVLGALKATGREHLTVSLLMIGVGIVLITVSGIAWRLTSHDAPSCRAMLGLQPAAAQQEPNRRFMPRVPPYGRPPHPYAAMLYPEFQYRPPPPSYQASMQEYRLRLLLLDRQGGGALPSQSPHVPTASASLPQTHHAPVSVANALSPVSPPPTYRSYASSTMHSRPPLNLSEYSRPPSYRSRASSVAVLRPGATDTMDSRRTLGGSSTVGGYQTEFSSATPGTPPPSSHSRDPSLTLSFLSHDSLFGDSGHSRPGTGPPMDPLLTSPSGESRTSVVAGLSDESPVGPLWTPEDPVPSPPGRKCDINTVTIVQTGDSSQVHNQDTVIVTVTGAQRTGDGEVQILAQV